MQENNFNKNDLGNELLNKLLDENKNFTTSKILEHVINMLMKAERRIHLEENENDKVKKMTTFVIYYYFLLASISMALKIFTP